MKRIGVIGGVHGDEPLGVAVAREVGGIQANPRAMRHKVRFTETDLNRSFLVQIPISYEERLATRLERVIRRGHYDCIVDLHTTRAHNSTCAIVTTEPNAVHRHIMHHMGLKKIVIMPPSHALISVKPDVSLALEISHGDRTYTKSYLVNRLRTLTIPSSRNTNRETIEIYRCVQHVHKKTIQRLRIPLRSFKNFVQLSVPQKKKLGLHSDTDYYPLFTKGVTIADGAFTLLAAEKKGS
ncbi:MAG: succinylglutamate desuccinylase/aspartoacylase family protein [Candidatus Roizmanbacteria bacterium]|nr:succinylglutamate desuccinylase/aspartoacylase family protein [Candidatus Roizmanbacteria bacterium]